jgi:DNA-binding NarL/FixJ family response regulator
MKSRAEQFPPSDRPLRIAIVLSHALLREGISRLLEQEGFHVEGCFGAVDEAVAALSGEPPNLVVLGWDSPGMTTSTVRELVQGVRDAAVVVLGGIQMPYDEKVMHEMIEVGASGCLSVDLSTPELVRSLRLLARGDLVVSREVVSPSHDAYAEGQYKPSAGDLTRRERQVLEFVARGATNREIAQTLIVTESTIKAHLNHILCKLDLRNRQQAAAFAIRHALVSDDGDFRRGTDPKP